MSSSITTTLGGRTRPIGDPTGAVLAGLGGAIPDGLAEAIRARFAGLDAAGRGLLLMDAIALARRGPAAGGRDTTLLDLGRMIRCLVAAGLRAGSPELDGPGALAILDAATPAEVMTAAGVAATAATATARRLVDEAIASNRLSSALAAIYSS